MPGSDVTQLLICWTKGDQSALEQLAPKVHGELHRLARAYLRRERPGHTLQPTALINEAYVRLIDGTRVEWQSRAHFLAIGAQTMRRILVDMARARAAERRNAGLSALPLEEALDASPDRSTDFVALDDALRALSAFDHRKAQVVELRYFGGFTAEESAEILGVSIETIRRDWRLAKAWLLRELEQS